MRLAVVRVTIRGRPLSESVAVLPSVGSQIPTIEIVPARLSSAIGEVAGLMREVGVELDEWQMRYLDHALGEREDGRWSAREAALIVPRQNGKNVVLAARELAGLFLFGERLIIHSAHLFNTSREHFRYLRGLLERSETLMAKVRRFTFSNGMEGIELVDGARLNFIARTRSAARGFTADCLVFDEAFELSIEAFGSMMPSLAAVQNPQIWFASSAPDQATGVLHGLRARARKPASETALAYSEWCCEKGVDPEDRAKWFASNPALGARISLAHVESEFAAFAALGADGLDSFARERLGVVAGIDGETKDVFDGKWRRLQNVRSKIVGQVSFGLDVAPDFSFASIGAAGRNDVGRLHLELVERFPKTDWVVEHAARLCSRHNAVLAVDQKSPAAILIDDLLAAGVPVVSPTVSEYVLACGKLRKFVSERHAIHLGQRPLDDAVVGAATRPVGDGWVFARAKSRCDVSPLVAVTLALWAIDRSPIEELSLSEMIT